MKILLIDGLQGTGKSMLVRFITDHAPRTFKVFDPFEQADIDTLWWMCKEADSRDAILVTNDFDALRKSCRGFAVARLEDLMTYMTRVRLS